VLPRVLCGLGSQSPLSESPNYQYCTYRFSLVNISQDVLFPIHKHMENDNDAYNKVDDLIMVDLQQPSVIVDQLGVVLEPRALESSLMMTDFSFASLLPSKCHFRDISSACSYNTWNGKSILSQTHNSPQLTAPKQTWTKLKGNVLKGNTISNCLARTRIAEVHLPSFSMELFVL